MISAVA